MTRAVPALEQAVLLAAGTSTDHYQLALAYSRSGVPDKAKYNWNFMADESERSQGCQGLKGPPPANSSDGNCFSALTREPNCGEHDSLTSEPGFCDAIFTSREDAGAVDERTTNSAQSQFQEGTRAAFDLVHDVCAAICPCESAAGAPWITPDWRMPFGISSKTHHGISSGHAKTGLRETPRLSQCRDVVVSKEGGEGFTRSKSSFPTG